jgi:hypothetical protein
MNEKEIREAYQVKIFQIHTLIIEGKLNVLEGTNRIRDLEKARDRLIERNNAIEKTHKRVKRIE